MNPSLDIRPATVVDLPTLLALYQHLTGEPPFSTRKAVEIFQNFDRYAGS